MQSKNLLSAFTFAACVAGFSSINAQTFTENIVSEWSFEEAIVDNVTGATGTIEGGGGTSYIDGLKNKALDFTGAEYNSIVIIEDDGTLDPINFTTESFTVSMWANVDPAFETEQTLLMKGSNGSEDADEDGNIAPNANGNRYTIHTKNGEVRFAIDDDIAKSQLGVNIADIDGGYPLNEWVHIVGVRSTELGELNLYVNGVWIGGRTDDTGELNLAGQRLMLGNFTNRANVSQGPIDEVAILNKALNDDEVAALYNSYLSSGVFKNNAIANITVAPNPVSSELIIQNATKLTKVEVYNLSGMMVKVINNANAGTIRSSVEGLPTGTYIVKGFSDDSVISSGSFIKQ